MLTQRTQFDWWQSNVLVKCEPEDIPAPLPDLYPMAKRVLDVFVALAALLILSPLWLIIAVLIKLDSPGPVFHLQKRTGRHGKPFWFYKFRSMTNGHDHTLEHRKFAEAYINGQETATLSDDRGVMIYKPKHNGHSVTRVGRFLRRTSLDELPQLINVLKGDMSLVGPRPTMDYETELYTERHKLRLAVLPGLTGWAQIHGRSTLCFEEIVDYDIEYIQCRSLSFDMKILVSTVPVVLTAQHAA